MKLEVLQNELQQQMTKQKEELDSLKMGLENRIKQAAEDTIRTELKAMVNESIGNVIGNKVREEVRLSAIFSQCTLLIAKQLSKQIPDNMRQQGLGHERQIHEVQTELHNSYVLSLSFPTKFKLLI